MSVLGASTEKRSIVNILGNRVSTADLVEPVNYSTMKSYVIYLLRGVTLAKELVSFKEHRVRVPVWQYVL